MYMRAVFNLEFGALLYKTSYCSTYHYLHEKGSAVGATPHFTSTGNRTGIGTTLYKSKFEKKLNSIPLNLEKFNSQI